MRRRLTTGALVALALGVAAWGAGSIPGTDGTCIVPAASAAGTEGCCHYNKGVCGCEGGGLAAATARSAPPAAAATPG